MAQVRIQEIKKTLRTQFAISDLRPGQEEVIRSLLKGQNTLAILPTGAGKSLCYQVPALHLPGTTVVISPLISLMKDQREKVENLGLEALEFNSVISAEQIAENTDRLSEQDQEQFIYTTPERLENPEFLKTLQQIKIDFVVIDEAHCVSQWGHDFRPAYLNIAQAFKALGQPPILALTATATPDVVCDIQKQLRLSELNVVRTTMMRDNLYLSAQVVESEQEKKQALVDWLRKQEGSGIIYAATVKAVQELQDFLQEQGVSSLIYHGKLKAQEREENQNEFMNNSPRLMIATNAFGMGIDKPDIRYVVHYNFPGSLEAYYQEAGRAGRDGKEAHCLLLYLKRDKSTQALFLARKYPSLEELTKVYEAFQKAGADSSSIAKKDIESALEDFPQRKLSVLISYLKQMEVIIEKRRGQFQIPRKNLNSGQLFHLAESYRERTQRDQDKLRQVIIYAQSALCRWKILADYFEEETEWKNCGHCDNCEHPVLPELEKEHSH